MSKSLLALAAIVAVVASPASAAPKHHVNHVNPTYATQNAYRSSASDVVIDGNRVVGQDPDLNIRTQLLRDSAVADY